MATWSDLNLQNSASPLMEQLIFFHDHTLLILLMITVLVSYIMLTLFFNKYTHRYLLEGQTIEVIWTILPAITLIFIALPSLRLLYLLDESMDPIITVKTIGHQWYWSYEYTDFVTPHEFDSYMIPLLWNIQWWIPTTSCWQSNSPTIKYSNSNTSNSCSCSTFMNSTCHSSKSSCYPRSTKSNKFFMNRPGLYYGQCSEICGTNHSFMPIVLESVNTKTFINWILNA
uniref:Cytochrome c oxidase subunit 2 n=1 Tax=Pseudokuzicus pieli TaxID=1945535 RepID=A0A1Q1MP02_9ORTH|nr:cytochrome c oxidase subunit II [Pseudokuzicus pieli]AQM39813.1 cytochrome c oxidase subunit 2 [Pseudokuzicus pieli]